MIVVWILAGFIAWMVLGAAVLAAMDDERMSLLLWAEECPVGGATAVMIAWPWCVWWIRRCAKRDNEQPNVEVRGR